MSGEYDVLVVGGGPCGAVAAKTAAEAGLSVLLIEKRPAVGVPVRCAETINKTHLPGFIEADPKWISAEITRSVIIAPDGTECFLHHSDDAAYYVLDRKVFDRELVWRATEAGAEIQVHARAVSPIMDGDRVTGAIIQQHGVTRSVRAKIVIAADGIESQFAKQAGIDTTLSLDGIHTCAQYLVHDIDIDETENRFYLSSADAPGGYIRVVPKGYRCVTIGVSIPGSKSGGGHCARNYLDAFIQKKYPAGKVTELIAGGVSVCRPLSCTAASGLLIVGDAARLSDPLTGWGMYHAMVSGKLAGEAAAAAIRKGDVSKNALMAYDAGLRETMGKALEESYAAREAFLEMDDETLSRFVHSMQR